MNVETFCEYFATFADAPNGVEKLRGLILQLAIQGKLLPQVADDASAAAALLAQSEIAESDTVSELKRRTCSDVTTEIPWADTLPKSWAATTLDKVCSQITDGEHITPPRIPNGDVPLATAKNVRDGFMDLETTDFISLETAEKCWRRCQPNQNDILMVCVGATTGRLTVLKETVPFVIVRSVALFRPILTLVIPEYLALLLRSPFGQEQIWRSVKQSAQPCLYISRSRQLTVPLPPLAEQRRIVEKVDQLLELCDELAARQATQREKRQRLVGATLDRLVSTRNPAESRTNAQRLRNHFDQLFATTTAIPQLRQTILQLAVQGQLVPQDPGDAPTETVHVGEVVSFLGGYAFKSEWFQDRPGIRLVRNQNISHGCLDWTETEYLPASRAEEFDKFTLHPGDMVLSLNRPFISTGLKLAWIQDSDCPCLLVQRVACMRPDRSRLLPEFLYLWCNAPDFYRNAHVVPSSGVPYIATNRVEKMCMTLPPLAEQKRIVTKVTELLSLCDALEAKLTQAESASTRLLSAAVHQLLNGAVANV